MNLWTPPKGIVSPPWTPPFGSGIPSPPAGGGGGGGGAWTLLSNTPFALAADIKVGGLTGHTHYCAMLRGALSQFPFIEELRMQISDDNAATFYSTFDHEGRKNSKHAGGVGETDTAYSVNSDWELIALGIDEGPNGLAQHGIWGWIHFWEPALAPSKEFHMEYSLVYENESNFATRTKGFGQYPSFTNGIGAINGFRLFNLNGFQATGSIDLYGIT
jgi:hypothetical protein